MKSEYDERKLIRDGYMGQITNLVTTSQMRQHGRTLTGTIACSFDLEASRAQADLEIGGPPCSLRPCLDQIILAYISNGSANLDLTPAFGMEPRVGHIPRVFCDLSHSTTKKPSPPKARPGPLIRWPLCRSPPLLLLSLARLGT